MPNNTCAASRRGQVGEGELGVEPLDDDDTADAGLIFLSNLHFILTALFVIGALTVLPIIIGLVFGIGLIGAPGTGTPVAARGPLITYLQTTGAFPEGQLTYQVLKFLRMTVFVSIYFLTGVGLQQRLWTAWVGTILFYGYFLLTSLGNWFVIVIVLVGYFILWGAKDGINFGQPIRREISLLKQGIRDQVNEIRNFSLD